MFEETLQLCIKQYLPEAGEAPPRVLVRGTIENWTKPFRISCSLRGKQSFIQLSETLHLELPKDTVWGCQRHVQPN